jgi:hypothetical protein
MDCRGFSDLLERMQEGRLGDDELREALVHADRCESCRRMLEPPSDLAEEIMRATSGSTCGRAREMLCDHLDGALDATDEALASMHLSACVECAALSTVLERLSSDLPSLAEMEPEPGLLAGVLARTSGRSWSARLRRSVHRALQRPRIALEGAYVGAFIFALVFITPGSPLAGVPRKALELSRINPVAELAGPVVKLHNRVSSDARSVLVSVDGRAREYMRYGVRAAECVREDIGTIFSRDASEQESEEQESNEGDER